MSIRKFGQPIQKSKRKGELML